MDFDKIVEATRMLISALGDDCSREGLQETPQRVAGIWKEFLQSEHASDEKLFEKTFSVERCSDFVLVKGIEFSSFCEHHLLPFFGKVAVAYIPSNGKVVGLSKIIRVVDKYSKRLQLQERLTQQIADAVTKNVSNNGVLVVVRAQHMCMTTRGVLQPHSETVTQATSGDFVTNKFLSLEALQLILQ